MHLDPSQPRHTHVGWTRPMCKHHQPPSIVGTLLARVLHACPRPACLPASCMLARVLHACPRTACLPASCMLARVLHACPRPACLPASCMFARVLHAHAPNVALRLMRMERSFGAFCVMRREEASMQQRWKAT